MGDEKDAMNIDHIHFYVEDAMRSRDWFVQTMDFEPVAGGRHKFAQTEVVKSGPIYFVLSSPLSSAGPVAEFLRVHPPGVADVAFRVADIEAVITHAIQANAKVLEPVQLEPSKQGSLKWAKIVGWGALEHTLLERAGTTPLLPSTTGGIPLLLPATSRGNQPAATTHFTGIDHVVLNVATGDLEPALAWYQEVLQFQPQRTFAIQTARSALRSEVMVHPAGSAQVPINEPASASSQIQEFLDLNRGPGIQHIALQTSNIVQAIAGLRQRGLSFLEVPTSYYTGLKQRTAELLLDWQALQTHQVLVDWQAQSPQALLLQTFTQPIFQQPTFFFELIQRQAGAQGFGEGNFLALFEAIEREQIKRGSLK